MVIFSTKPLYFSLTRYQVLLGNAWMPSSAWQSRRSETSSANATLGSEQMVL